MESSSRRNSRRGRHRAPERRRWAGWVAAGSAPAVLAFAGAGLASAETTAPARHPAVTVHQSGDRTGPGVRALPRSAPLPRLDPAKFRAPQRTQPVRPIVAPRGTVRIGDLQAPTPNWMNSQQRSQVNNAAADAEAQVATAADSVGLPAARSDRVAAAVVGDSAAGAAIATATVGAPLAAAGALVGGVAGLIVGVPFLPAGLVAGPIAGAAIGAAATAAPFTALGAGIGAGVGLARGLAEPPHR
uniref:hypothetical protein n=1 Tax=Gordonia sp. B7-2 TaxID=3420932 RepID=UPI003D89FCBA